MKKVIKERKDIAFFTLLYPLPMHKDAYAKSKAVACEKSLSMLDDAYEKKPLPAAKCETKVIDDNIALAQKLGISGTPAIILPDGRLIPGYMESGALIQQIDKK